MTAVTLHQPLAKIKIRDFIGARDWLMLAGVAVGLRLLVFLVASSWGDISLNDYTRKADSASYITYAAAIANGGAFHSIPEYDRRVFPGYPLMIAAVHLLGVPIAVAALLVTWLSAGFAAAGAASLYSDRRMGYAMICLIPHYLINSSMAMSEAPLLAVAIAGLLLGRAEKPLSTGAVLAFAVFIRPMACFILGGAVLLAVIRKRHRLAVRMIISALAIFALGYAFMQYWTGNPLQGTKIYATHPGAYGGHMFGWPFESLLSTPFHEPTSVGRIIYTWLHVVITLAACVMLTHRTLSSRGSHARDILSVLWLLGNTAFVLCVGSAWGFRHFPRFTIPAAPGMFWALQKYLPRSTLIWGLIGLACLVIGVVGVIHSP